MTTKTTTATEINTESNKIRDDQLQEAIAHLSKAAELLGFAIAIPKPRHDDDPIRGFVVGTHEYIDEISEAHGNLSGGRLNATTEELSEL